MICTIWIQHIKSNDSQDPELTWLLVSLSKVKTRVWLSFRTLIENAKECWGIFLNEDVIWMMINQNNNESWSMAREQQNRHQHMNKKKMPLIYSYRCSLLVQVWWTLEIISTFNDGQILLPSFYIKYTIYKQCNNSFSEIAW